MKITHEAKKIEVGDVIYTHNAYFLIVGKLLPDGYGSFESSSKVTAVNLTRECTTAHECRKVEDLIELLSKGENYEIIKSEKVALIIKG